MAIGVVAMVGFSIVSTGAFTSVDAQRDATINVGDGLVGLETADQAFVGQRCPLTELTNNVDSQAVVTVTLVDGRTGQLYADGQKGDSVTFRLDPNETETVEVKVNNRADTVAYTIDVSGEIPNVNFGQRTADIENPPPRKGGAKGPPPRNPDCPGTN